MAVVDQDLADALARSFLAELPAELVGKLRAEGSGAGASVAAPIGRDALIGGGPAGPVPCRSAATAAVSRGDQAVGMSTLSMRYTVALRVWRLPHRTRASFTVYASPVFSMATLPPSSVGRVPAVRSVGARRSPTTW